MYHGDKDDVVDVNVSIKTYEKLKDGNAKDVELKIINNDNHFLTSHAFKDQYIYEWLEKKVKEKQYESSKYRRFSIRLLL